MSWHALTILAQQTTRAKDVEVRLTLPEFHEVLGPYMGVFFAAFIMAFIATPVMHWFAVRYGIVDWPDLRRKKHVEPVAYLGGVAIFLGWLMGVFASFYITPHNQEMLSGQSLSSVSFPESVVLGAMIIVLVGLFDDVYGISPRVKIGGQLLAAACLVNLGVGTELIAVSLGEFGIELPYRVSYLLGAAAVTVFVVGGCNAVNLMDGLDGLASGIVAIACLGFLYLAIHAANHIVDVSEMELLRDPVRIVMVLAVFGAIMGFLPYNFNPANIFMGDAGSLLLGYLCVSTILLFSHVSRLGPLFVLAAIIVVALPITDTSLAIFRRAMRGQPIFEGDSEHLHHQLLRLYQRTRVGPNGAVKLAVLTMYGLGFAFAAIGASLVHLPWVYGMAVFVCIFGFVAVTAYKSGHINVILARARREAEAEQGEHEVDEAAPLLTPRENEDIPSDTHSPEPDAVTPDLTKT